MYTKNDDSQSIFITNVLLCWLYLYLSSGLGSSGQAIFADWFDLKIMATRILCRLWDEFQHASQLVILGQLRLSLQKEIR